MNLRILYISICCTLMFFHVSCTREKLGGCPNVYVNIGYTGDSNGDVMDKYISGFSWYVYDSSGNLVTDGKSSISRAGSRNVIEMALPVGDYRMICWGNAGHYCTIDGISRIDDATVHTGLYGADGLPYSMDPLYYSSIDFKVESEDDVISLSSLFSCAHITLWLYVRGYRETDASGKRIPPRFAVGDFCTSYDFHCSHTGGISCFSPETVYESDSEITMAHCHLPRFDSSFPAEISLYSGITGHLVEKVDLTRFIRDNGISVEKSEEVDIPVLLEFSEVGCTVRLPEWDNETARPVM